MSLHIDTEKTRKIVDLATEKMNAVADPWLLADYQNLFRKEVSLFNRSKVAAYLLMLIEQGKAQRFLEEAVGQRAARQKGRGYEKQDAATRKSKPRNGEAERKNAASDTGEGRRYPLAAEDSKWLFFSVGKSRHISPRDILSLIHANTELSKEDLGAIRIFDSYSFVQVRETYAQTLIESLTGRVFRGRPLIVNHAKSRKDEAAGTDQAETDDFAAKEVPEADGTPELASEFPAADENLQDPGLSRAEVSDKHGDDQAQEETA